MKTLNIYDGSALGKKIGNFTVNKFNTRSDEGEYYSVKTGVSDYLGDEIILTVWPDRKIVTDEGYTEYLLDTDPRRMRIGDARKFIESSGVELTNSYNAHMTVHYEDDNWEEAVHLLTACIVDTCAIFLAKKRIR